MKPLSDKHGVCGPFWDDLRGEIQLPPFQSGGRTAVTSGTLYLSMAWLSAAIWRLPVL